MTPETVVLPLFCILPPKVQSVIQGYTIFSAVCQQLVPQHRSDLFCSSCLQIVVVLCSDGPARPNLSSCLTPQSHINTKCERLSCNRTCDTQCDTHPPPLKKKRKRGLHQTLGTMFFGYITQRNPGDQNTDNKK